VNKDDVSSVTPGCSCSRIRVERIHWSSARLSNGSRRDTRDLRRNST